MIRILHVFNSNLISGPEKSVIPGLEQLNSLYPELAIEVLFLEEKRLGSKQKKATEYAQKFGFKVHSIEVNSRYDRSAIRVLRNILESNKFDIVHAQDVKATVYSSEASKGLPLRKISTFHGFARHGLKDRLYEALYFFHVLKGDDLVTISTDNYKRLSRMYQFSKLKVHRIENKIPRPLTLPLDEIEVELKRIAPEQMEHPRGVMLARFSQEKDHKTLFASLARLNPETKLTIWLFGFGPMEDELKILAKTLQIESKIVFGGYLEEAEKYLSGFDFMLLTSWAEGLPISLLEGSWLGLPLIGTDIPGIRKVLPQENLGFFSPVKDSDKLAQNLTKLLSLTLEERDKMKARIVAHMEQNFNHKEWCQQMLELYQGK